jgi:glycosyltransferase involved in cell wall biosynthesis
MKKIIFHIPYKINLNIFSTPNIRPQKLINSFIQKGFDVKVISGFHKERKKIIYEIKEDIKNGIKYDFLYSESSTMPTLLTDENHLPKYPFLLDFSFFRYCKRNSIPIGLFYRDIHWKFKQFEIEKYSLKYFISIFFYKLDLFFYSKLLDVLFLPSLNMMNYLKNLKNIKNIVALPSGHDKSTLPINKDKNSNLRILYVGGLNEMYDLKLLIKSIYELNNSKIFLDICTRESDYLKVKDEYKLYFENNNNIKLYFSSGDQLDLLYSKADICSLFVRPHEYWNFTMPYKLLEYISKGKPIIVSSGSYVSKIIKDNSLGPIVIYEKNQLLRVLLEILNDKSILDKYNEPINKYFELNKWEERVEIITNNLE